MLNNYFKYNNIIFLNLTKQKLKIQSYLISWKKNQFFFNYFEINGLKKNSISLSKKFWNKKLSVFFISNLNMIESKWSLLKTYNLYYKNYIYKKKRKFYFIKYGYILNNIYSNICNDFFIFKEKKIINLYIWKFYLIYKFKNIIKNLKLHKLNIYIFKYKKNIVAKNIYKKKMYIKIFRKNIFTYRPFLKKKKKLKYWIYKKALKITRKKKKIFYNNLGFRNGHILKKKKKKKKSRWLGSNQRPKDNN
jgi:hypothetical protein